MPEVSESAIVGRMLGSPRMLGSAVSEKTTVGSYYGDVLARSGSVLGWVTDDWPTAGPLSIAWTLWSSLPQRRTLIAPLDDVQIQIMREEFEAGLERDPQPRLSMAALHELSPTDQLESPILATLEEYPDRVIASVGDLSAYGDGTSEAEALDSLRHNILQLLQGLGELEPGSELARRWQRLLRIRAIAKA